MTNVSKDHLGEYGVYTVEDMAQTKGVVYRAVHDRGARVINMDDPLTAPFAERAGPSTVLLTVGEPRDAVAKHCAEGGRAVYAHDGVIYIMERTQARALIDVSNMPLAHGGAALYNVRNALGAIGLGLTIGLDDASMVAALADFGAAWHDNPGRGQCLDLNGVKVCLDFGHNPHGVEAVLQMVDGLRGDTGRLSLCICQAGDRSETDIAEMCEAVAKAKPDLVRLRALPEVYQRGRSPAEMQRIFREHLLSFGMASDQILDTGEAIQALDEALAWAKPGDVVVHLVHVERACVEDRLRTLGALS